MAAPSAAMTATVPLGTALIRLDRISVKAFSEFR
jgi:hypothetical protein